VSVRLAWAAAAALAAGCGPLFAVPDISTVPASPAWATDVKPYLADHCLVCHGDAADRGARDFYRLDVCDIHDPADTDQKLGAWDMRSGILDRAVARRTMPPVWLGEGLGPNGRELLRRWIMDRVDYNDACGY